jgi:hypothetical protein
MPCAGARWVSCPQLSEMRKFRGQMAMILLENWITPIDVWRHNLVKIDNELV